MTWGRVRGAGALVVGAVLLAGCSAMSPTTVAPLGPDDAQQIAAIPAPTTEAVSDVPLDSEPAAATTAPPPPEAAETAPADPPAGDALATDPVTEPPPAQPEPAETGAPEAAMAAVQAFPTPAEPAVSAAQPPAVDPAAQPAATEPQPAQQPAVQQPANQQAAAQQTAVVEQQQAVAPAPEFAAADPAAAAAQPPTAPEAEAANAATAAQQVPAAPAAPPAAAADPGAGMAELIERGPNDRLEVALTFDAGSDLGYTAEILDLLRDEGIAVTFGMTGAWAEQNPEMLQRMVAEGHQLMNHTYSHPSLTGVNTGQPPLTYDQLAAELADTERVVRDLTGYEMKPWFRPPYGDYDATTLGYLNDLGYRYSVMWTCDSHGWSGWSGEKIVDYCTTDVLPHEIVLMHLGSGAAGDYEALPGLIAFFRQQGYAFVTVEQMLQT